MSSLKLSICITTFNRGRFIVATIDSILSQITRDCEIVVLDGGSTDDTEAVLADYASRDDRLRYVRQATNNGFDRDCDRVVELARGEYCWLMTDDDLLKAGAVSTVLEAVHRGFSLVVVNTEIRSFTMSTLLQSRWLDLDVDRVYRSEELDRLVCDIGNILRFIGCLVVKREIWLLRERERYYGSMFVYLGVIFQNRLPGEALVIAKPLISYRTGNSHTFSPKMFETFMISLPELVSTLELSEDAKEQVWNSHPWKVAHELLMWRALGAYSLVEYRSFIRPRLRSAFDALLPGVVAVAPGAIINFMLQAHYALSRRCYRGMQRDVVLQALQQSRFDLGLLQGVVGASGEADSVR